MTDSTPAGTADFTADERHALAYVLDALVPPSPDGRLPGAGAAGIATYVEAVLRTLPDLRVQVVDGLRELDAQAQAQHGTPFVALDASARAALVALQPFSYALVPHTYIGYYQQDRVLTAIGVEPRPPHPKGYTVPENDLSLLEPVKARGPRYRAC